MFQQEFAAVTDPAPLRFDRNDPQILPMLGEALGEMADGIVVTDTAGRIVFYNAAFRMLMHGVGQASIDLGAPIARIFPAAQLHTGQPFEICLTDGRWVDVRQASLGSGACFTLRDITQAKLRELSVREKEEFYRAVINIQTEFIVRFTPEGVVTFSNDAYCRYMNRAPGELSNGQSDFDYIEDEDQQEHLDHIRSLTPLNPTRTVVFRSTVGEGIKWEEWTDTGVFDETGKLVELQAIGRDITARKLAELQLAQSEERYRTVVNTQTEFVARFRPDGRTSFANDAYRRYMESEQPGQGACSRFDFVHPDDQERHTRHIKGLSPANPTDTIILRTVAPSGAVRWERWSDTGVFDERGAITEIQAVGRDITRERETEEALERQREALHQTEKLAALGSLLAGVAHELNNPLSIVVGYSGMLHETAEDDVTRRRAKEVHVAAERCARIIKTFLAMARSKPAVRSAVDIEAQLDSVLELTSYGLRTSGIEVVRKKSGTLPTTLGDADQLHQVFMNLVLNAQQAMVTVSGPRRLMLSTSISDEMLTIAIEDTGTGMPDHVLARAFEPFFTTKPQGVGTGIGLSVCLGIVEAHAGRITVESAVGRGTRFLVTLPIVRGEGVEDVQQRRLPDLVGTVLVVDDEPAIAELVATTLRSRGITVATAAGGLEAIRALEAQNFDAVLTDLRMADLGGDKLIEIIAVLRPEMAGRIIVMTGDALGGGIGLKHANVTVLEKPLDLDALHAALAPLLKVH